MGSALLLFVPTGTYTLFAFLFSGAMLLGITAMLALRAIPSIRRAGPVSLRAKGTFPMGIALGLSKDLLQRAASVTLKERRPLVVVPRETPLDRPTLQHLLALHDAGAVVLPASPGFYGGADSVQRLVDFVAGKVLDALRVEHDLLTRWTGELGSGQA